MTGNAQTRHEGADRACPVSTGHIAQLFFLTGWLVALLIASTLFCHPEKA